MPSKQPARLIVAAERSPRDRRVQHHVSQLVQHLVEPSAKGRARALQPRQPPVRRIEHQGQRQADATAIRAIQPE